MTTSQEGRRGKEGLKPCTLSARGRSHCIFEVCSWLLVDFEKSRKLLREARPRGCLKVSFFPTSEFLTSVCNFPCPALAAQGCYRYTRMPFPLVMERAFWASISSALTWVCYTYVFLLPMPRLSK